jgi:hypothetical protein
VLPKRKPNDNSNVNGSVKTGKKANNNKVQGFMSFENCSVT